MRPLRFLFAATAAVALLTWPASAQQNLTLTIFERYLESLRQQAGIPGLSGAVLYRNTPLWEKGLGQQDVERALPATPTTPYLIGNVTQAVSSTMALVCLERADLSLSDPVARWTALIPGPTTTVGDVLRHTTAGSGFLYNPSAFAALTPVLEDCGDRPLPRLMVEFVLDRVAMFDSVPGHDIGTPGDPVRDLFDATQLGRYDAAIADLALPYRSDRSGRVTVGQYPLRGLNASTGLISTVRDLAKFLEALDTGVLLRADTLAAAWNNVSASGASTPTGLGWFVQSYRGERIVWQFGHLPDAHSALVIVVPGRQLTFILLANSDRLSAPFPLASGDVTVSLFAQLFLRTFVP